MKGSAGDEPPWEVEWWHYVDGWLAEHPELNHQKPALAEWRKRLEQDPIEVPSFLLPGDELGVRVSRPPGTDVVAWQVIDWRETPNTADRRIVYIRRCRGLDEA